MPRDSGDDAYKELAAIKADREKLDAMDREANPCKTCNGTGWIDRSEGPLADRCPNCNVALPLVEIPWESPTSVMEWLLTFYEGLRADPQYDPRIVTDFRDGLGDQIEVVPPPLATQPYDRYRRVVSRVIGHVERNKVIPEDAIMELVELREVYAELNRGDSQIGLMSGSCSRCGVPQNVEGNEVSTIHWRCHVCGGLVCRSCTKTMDDEGREYHSNTYCSDTCWEHDGSPED